MIPNLISKIKASLSKGDQRSARARKNIVAMAFLRGLSAFCSFFVVPLTIGYVSKYEYGIWITISSLVAWLSFFDLGIGNGLRNKFIEAIEKGKHKLAKVYVSTSYALIGLIVGAVWIIAMAGSLYVNWAHFLNVDPRLNGELTATILIVVTNFSVLFILGLNRSLLNAVQKPAIASSFDTSTQVLLCIVLMILVKFTKGSLINLALAMGGTSILVLVISNIWTFSHLLKKYRPSIKCVRFKFAKGIMSMGLLFFWLQIIAIAIYQTNNLIISHYAGPDEVTVYNIAYRYAQLLSMIFTIIITPFWSAFAEANVNGDTEWMKVTTRKLIKIVGLLAIVGLIMVVAAPVVYKIWINDVVKVPFIITLLVFIFQILNIWSVLWTQLLSGLGKVRLQTIMSTLCCGAYLVLGLYGCKMYGITGLLSASIISFIVFTSWFGVIQVYKLINKTAKGIWNK